MPTLSALSIAAAALATIAALVDRRTTALFLALVACVAISASLLLGLQRHRGIGMARPPASLMVAVPRR